MTAAQKPTPIVPRTLADEAPKTTLSRVEARRAVILNPKLSHSARLLYCIIDDMADKDTGIARVKQQKLQLFAGMSRSSVQRALVELRAVIQTRRRRALVEFLLPWSSGNHEASPVKHHEAPPVKHPGDAHLITYPGSVIQFPPNPPQAGGTLSPNRPSKPEVPPVRRSKSYTCPRCRDRGHRDGRECECQQRRRDAEYAARRASMTELDRRRERLHLQQSCISQGLTPYCDLCGTFHETTEIRPTLWVCGPCRRSHAAGLAQVGSDPAAIERLIYSVKGLT